jgi:hypothetical protein
LFKGLPNDQCQCEHMGYVIKGKHAGTEVVEFSPTEHLGQTMEVVTKNMEKLEAASS